MKPEGWVENHNPVSYESLSVVIDRLQTAKRDLGAIYIGTAFWNNGKATEPGWVVWHGGLFVNPFDAHYFFSGDIDLVKSQGRLLQPNEILRIRYTGEVLNGSTPPEGVPVSVLVQQLRNANKEMGAIEIEKAVWKDGTTSCPSWVIWHGGVYVNPFKAEFFLADHLDEEKTIGRLLRPEEPLEAKHHG